jgi:hypothetical protein
MAIQRYDTNSSNPDFSIGQIWLEFNPLFFSNFARRSPPNEMRKIKRMHTGVKASFGDASSQYEMVGGTRLRDRKTA